MNISAAKFEFVYSTEINIQLHLISRTRQYLTCVKLIYNDLFISHILHSVYYEFYNPFHETYANNANKLVQIFACGFVLIEMSGE